MTITTALLELLVSATREAYTLLVDGNDPAGVYARLTNTYAEYGLDANVAESSVDWYEGGTLVESLEYELERLPANEAPTDEPCDCGDFENCPSCHAWAVETLASGFSPWSLKFIESGDVVPALPPKWY